MAAEEHINIVDNLVEIRTMTDEEMVANWAAESKISADAMDKLVLEGFTSLDAVKLIEPNDLTKTKIPRGQQKLIIASVQKLVRADDSAGNFQPAAQRAEKSNTAHLPSAQVQAGLQTAQVQAGFQAQPELPLQDGGGHQQQQTGDDVYVQALLQQLQNGQSATRLVFNNNPMQGTNLSGLGISTNAANDSVLQNTRDVNSPSTQSWRDPQIYLAAAASGKSSPSCYDITDFVAGNMEEEIVVGGNGAQQVVLKTGPKKTQVRKRYFGTMVCSK